MRGKAGITYVYSIILSNALLTIHEHKNVYSAFMNTLLYTFLICFSQISKQSYCSETYTADECWASSERGIVVINVHGS